VLYIENESRFKLNLFKDRMASDSLDIGLRLFIEDGEALKELLRDKLKQESELQDL